MKCPFCGGQDTEVLESRTVEEGEGVRRRRECKACHKRFTTFEKTRDSILWVIKKDGRREPFDREKVKKGILRAIEKRPVSLQLVDDVVNEVEMEMLRRGSEEVATKIIGKSVLNRLKRIDKVAWLRFASVYLQFEDLSDFEKAIEDA
ncbi:transcriptional regulator NrdR [Candidatus Woesebacteria bacterium RIFCSPHIGHO2_12_FULL_46_16]|uniref:Transcriptional repressor NrdR n=1 Tax=Candidatus Woesebacteria bacterium RIFCSPHIGHO2_12_FULL_46_16 TaxID=1802513 RepID=A0A1F8B1J0_9BACT|nr:MAG: transcriptional regulator NrdR [Candidatus Woesebacteria bacterium RIFCSPHIGHO2_12_FULL_46_16]